MVAVTTFWRRPFEDSRNGRGEEVVTVPRITGPLHHNRSRSTKVDGRLCSLLYKPVDVVLPQGCQ